MGATEQRQSEQWMKDFDTAPTWRAKCRIQGSADPRRFELWGVCEDLNLSSLKLVALQPSLIEFT